MPSTTYKRLDHDETLFLVNYLLLKLKNSPLSDNTTYSVEKSQDGQSFLLKATDGSTTTTVATISGLLTDTERAKLARIGVSATTLASYGITDAYTKTETDAAILSGIAAAGHLKFTKVQELPTAANAEMNTIYLVPVNDGADNVYMEWYIEEKNNTKYWEKLGTTSIDLSGYVQRNDMATFTNQEITTIVDSAYAAVFNPSSGS